MKAQRIPGFKAKALEGDREKLSDDDGDPRIRKITTQIIYKPPSFRTLCHWRSVYFPIVIVLVFYQFISSRSYKSRRLSEIFNILHFVLYTFLTAKGITKAPQICKTAILSYQCTYTRDKSGMQTEIFEITFRFCKVKCKLRCPLEYSSLIIISGLNY